jgi:hypothetical protein
MKGNRMKWLCDMSDYLSSGHSDPAWSSWSGQTDQLTNFLICFAYLVIAYNLFVLYRSKKAELPVPDVFVLGTASALLCGLSHLCHLLGSVWAPYRPFLMLNAVTAAISVVVACRIPGIVRWMVKLPPREHVHAVNKKLADELSQAARAKRDLAHKVETLKERVKNLEYTINTSAWITEKSALMEQLSRTLSERKADSD